MNSLLNSGFVRFGRGHKAFRRARRLSLYFWEGTKCAPKRSTFCVCAHFVHKNVCTFFVQKFCICKIFCSCFLTNVKKQRAYCVYNVCTLGAQYVHIVHICAQWCVRKSPYQSWTVFERGHIEVKLGMEVDF